MVCPECNGTRLRLHSEMTTMKGVEMRLYRDEECQRCGGRGYLGEGEQEYHVKVYIDEKQVQTVYLVAQNAPAALMLASEQFAEVWGTSVRPGEYIALTVEEK